MKPMFPVSQAAIKMAIAIIEDFVNAQQPKEDTMADESVGVITMKVEVPIAVKQATEQINVPLETDEKVKIGQVIASLVCQADFLKEELKKSVTAQRSAITALKGTIWDHAKTLSNGYRQELATVEHHLDFNLNEVSVIYKGKLLKTRAMTDDEKQLDLDMCVQMGMNLKVKPTKLAKAG